VDTQKCEFSPATKIPFGITSASPKTVSEVAFLLKQKLFLKLFGKIWTCKKLDEPTISSFYNFSTTSCEVLFSALKRSYPKWTLDPFAFAQATQQRAPASSSQHSRALDFWGISCGADRVGFARQGSNGIIVRSLSLFPFVVGFVACELGKSSEARKKSEVTGSRRTGQEDTNVERIGSGVEAGGPKRGTKVPAQPPAHEHVQSACCRTSGSPFLHRRGLLCLG
jgi:hypothetical protein